MWLIDGWMVTIDHIQLTHPKDSRIALGQWVRAMRQRAQWTQPMLASKTGVAVSSLSRLEREGAGSIDSFLRVLQALGELNTFHTEIQERLRKANLPLDISDLKTPRRPRQRVRKAKNVGP